jgi:rhodanese-related sulfurtransferase
LPESSQLQHLTAAQIRQEQRLGALILDTRPTEGFTSFHIPGSMQIGLAGPFASWAAILIKPRQRILLVTETTNCAQEAHSRLARVGFEDVDGYTVADKHTWREQGLEPGRLPIYQGKNACRALRANPAAQFIDVRSRAEWLRGHLRGAVSMPLLGFTEQALTISPSKPILVYCQDEYRATIAASILLRYHTVDVGILAGELQEWQACGESPETPQDEVVESSSSCTQRAS